jgi:hypothetical protein
MDREKLFKEFIEECKKNSQICGAGNPYAQILLVGQEHRSDEPIKSEKEWQSYLEKNYRYCEIENPWIDENSDLWRKYQNSTPTWNSYQRLIDEVLQERKKRVLQGDKDFEFDAFTTELNNEAKPSSRVKGKEEREKLRERIQARLKMFKQSNYIKSFPVIILACGGYIRNDEKVREIDDTFHVTFSKRYDNSAGNWFCTHYDDMNPKRLVIHTRQLSNGVSYKMIDEMASVIRDHLKKLGLI